jgi:hypothetical protein
MVSRSLTPSLPPSLPPSIHPSLRPSSLPCAQVLLMYCTLILAGKGLLEGRAPEAPVVTEIQAAVDILVQIQTLLDGQSSKDAGGRRACTQGGEQKKGFDQDGGLSARQRLQSIVSFQVFGSALVNGTCVRSAAGELSQHCRCT